MAGTRAIKVPLGILAQHAQVGGLRLPKFQKLEKPKVVVVPQGGVLEQRPWLRKYCVYPSSRKDQVECRWCDKLTSGFEMHPHCFPHVNLVIQRLMDKKMCAVCCASINPTACSDEYDRCPICSDRCMAVWLIVNCNSFKREREKYMREIVDGTTAFSA